MSINPLASKIAAPYARALFDFSIEKNIMHQITADFQNLSNFLGNSTEFLDYLSNPVVTKDAKRKILTRVIKSEINTETFKFLMILIERDRINILSVVINRYLQLVYETASIKMIDVVTAYDFTNAQKTALINKLKELINAREVQLIVSVDPTLIGGFLIKTDSKVLDFSLKNQLQQLAKHLDTVLEI